MSRELLSVVTQGTPEFERELGRLVRRGETDLDRVEPVVRQILAEVRSEGDRALRRSIEKYENRRVEQLYVPDYGGKAALEALPGPVRAALSHAAERIERYHRAQARQLESFEYEEDGVRLGSRVTPLARVGIYAPGGKARYPSSVLMSAIPAKVAGVTEIVVASPDVCSEVRAACHLAGVQAVLDAGGAHAIAALAYGTETVPRVDKIVGPGNIYVTAAKRQVFGEVSIDSIAGPSEILVIADEHAEPDVVAADLLSQAEHDEAAYPLLLTTSSALAAAVLRELRMQLDSLPRRAIAEASLLANGVALVVDSSSDLATIGNQLAAEHVSVQTKAARAMADRILRAGAVFVGGATPEAAGDYLAGPSHVLPTGGAARHSAPLGVYDFVARSSIIEYAPSALASQQSDITTFARAEGLEAHARAVEVRVRR